MNFPVFFPVADEIFTTKTRTSVGPVLTPEN